MPKRLNIDPTLDAETKDWVRALLRIEMTDKRVTYRELVDLLKQAGLDEKETNLRNKIARGEMSAANLLLCLKVLGTRAVNLDRWSLDENDAWNIDRALEDDLITVVERDDPAGIYRVRLGQLPIPITITLERRSSKGTTTYVVSHAIKTPEMAEPHRPVLPSDRNPERALRRAIRGLTGYYRLAVESGHVPIDDWLIPSDQLGPGPKYNSVGERIT